MSRKQGWGQWTEVKLDALSRYMPAFNRASSRSRATHYLDLFAGSDRNVSRTTGRLITSSGERALQTQPPFSTIRLFELSKPKASSLRAMLARYPGRDADAIEGDCNVEVPKYLAQLRVVEPKWRLVPTFAFIDQFSAEVNWSTLKALAEFKDLTKVATKVELWMYFGESFISRGLELRSNLNTAYAERVDQLFGDDEWRELLQATWDGRLDGTGFQREMVNLMRWKLERQLGYSRTISMRFIRDSGHSLYTMIYATDHWAGDKIMTQVLGVTEGQLGDIKQRARLARMQARHDKERGMVGGGMFTMEQFAGEDTDVRELELLDLAAPLPPWHLRDDSSSQV